MLKLKSVYVCNGLTIYELKINSDIIYLLNSTIDDTNKNIYIVNSHNGKIFQEYNNNINILKKYNLESTKKININKFTRIEKIKSLHD